MAVFIRLIIRLFQLVFQPEQYFSLTTNQPTVFFSRLIGTAERLLYLLLLLPPVIEVRSSSSLVDIFDVFNLMFIF
jgi:hypothetical protein